MVEYLADNVAVMYLGQIVESAEVNQLCQQPLHPYTLALFSAVPSVEVKSRRQRIVLTGDVPSPSQPPVGCRFHPRCPLAENGLPRGRAPPGRPRRPPLPLPCCQPGTGTLRW